MIGMGAVVQPKDGAKHPEPMPGENHASAKVMLVLDDGTLVLDRHMTGSRYWPKDMVELVRAAYLDPCTKNFPRTLQQAFGSYAQMTVDRQPMWVKLLDALGWMAGSAFAVWLLWAVFFSPQVPALFGGH